MHPSLFDTRPDHSQFNTASIASFLDHMYVVWICLSDYSAHVYHTILIEVQTFLLHTPIAVFHIFVASFQCTKVKSLRLFFL